MGSKKRHVNPKKKAKAFAMRLAGCSYREIQKKLDIPSRGTLSHWFKNLTLSVEAKKRLEDYTLRAAQRGFFAFNRERTKQIEKENDVAFQKGHTMIGALNKKGLTLVGAALYWGEGTKAVSERHTPQLVFTNSNPVMIGVFLRFIKEILHVPETHIRADLHLYKSIEHEKAKRYWSGVTGIPTNRLWSTNLVSRLSKGKRPIHRLPYGTIAIRISGRALFYEVQGMISGIVEG